jgi:hypothetical protein
VLGRVGLVLDGQSDVGVDQHQDVEVLILPVDRQRLALRRRVDLVEGEQPVQEGHGQAVQRLVGVAEVAVCPGEQPADEGVLGQLAGRVVEQVGAVHGSLDGDVFRHCRKALLVPAQE